jgi:hypothetical protein
MHIVKFGEIGNVYKNLVEKPHKKEPLATSRRRKEDKFRWIEG